MGSSHLAGAEVLIRFQRLSERESRGLTLTGACSPPSVTPHVTVRTVLEVLLDLEAVLGAGVHPPPGLTFHLDEEAFIRWS